MNPDTAALLTRVRDAGGDLMPEGDDLRVRASAPLPEELLVALRAHKSEVLAAIRPPCGFDAYHRRSSCSLLTELHSPIPPLKPRQVRVHRSHTVLTHTRSLLVTTTPAG